MALPLNMDDGSKMKAYREAVVAALQTSLGPNTSIKYEKVIYTTSKKISNRDGSAVEDVYREIAFVKVGHLLSADTKEKREAVLQEIKDEVPEFECAIYTPQKLDYEASITKINQKPTAIQGVYKCKNRKAGCDSDLFYIWNVQARGLDEGMTVMRQCAKCGDRGKE